MLKPNPLPKPFQNPSKTTPQTLPRAKKSFKRCPRDPRGAQETSKSVPEAPKERPKDAQERPGGAQEPPKPFQNGAQGDMFSFFCRSFGLLYPIFVQNHVLKPFFKNLHRISQLLERFGEGSGGSFFVFSRMYIANCDFEKTLKNIDRGDKIQGSCPH